MEGEEGGAVFNVRLAGDAAVGRDAAEVVVEAVPAVVECSGGGGASRLVFWAGEVRDIRTGVRGIWEDLRGEVLVWA